MVGSTLFRVNTIQKYVPKFSGWIFLMVSELADKANISFQGTSAKQEAGDCFCRKMHLQRRDHGSLVDRKKYDIVSSSMCCLPLITPPPPK